MNIIMGIMDGCHVQKYQMTEHWKQADYIVRKLCGVSSYMSNVRDTVKFIEEAGVENFDFDYLCICLLRLGNICAIIIS